MIELNADGSITLAEFPVWDGNGGFAFQAVKIRYPRGRHYRAARNQYSTIAQYTTTAQREAIDNATDPAAVDEVNVRWRAYMDEAIPKWIGEVLRNGSDAVLPPDDRADDWREEFPPYAFDIRLPEMLLRHWRSSPFASG